MHCGAPRLGVIRIAIDNKLRVPLKDVFLKASKKFSAGSDLLIVLRRSSERCNCASKARVMIWWTPSFRFPVRMTC